MVVAEAVAIAGEGVASRPLSRAVRRSAWRSTGIERRLPPSPGWSGSVYRPSLCRSDVYMGSVVKSVRLHRCDGHGEAWRLLVARHDRIEAWLKQHALTVVKVGELLAGEGVVVPERTLHRYAGEVCDVGRGRRGTTLRVNRR